MLEALKPPSGGRFSVQYRLELRHWPPTVENQDRLPVSNLIDECAEIVLGFGQCGSLHLAVIAN